MDKWADFVIVGVKYDDSHSRILIVKRYADLGDKLGTETIERRTEIVDDIKAKRTHVTAYWDDNGKKWTKGEKVGLFNLGGTDFIQTDANGKKKDNLGNLPEF